MTGKALAAVLLAAAVVAGGVAGAVVVVAGDDDSGDEAGTASPGQRGLAKAGGPNAPPTDCENLELESADRAAVERSIGQRTVRGSVYYGACDGHFWAMARLRSGGDGVFRDVRSARALRLGSIAKARCEVPLALLRQWRRAGGCIAGSPKPDEPTATVEQPAPDPAKPDPRTRAERCRVPEVKVPNYDPTDTIPDQRLPRPEELMPPRDKCPEAYEGIRGDNPQPGGRRRYPNGRTYIEQVNHCRVMREQGVPCVVPPPP